MQVLELKEQRTSHAFGGSGGSLHDVQRDVAELKAVIMGYARCAALCCVVLRCCTDRARPASLRLRCSEPSAGGRVAKRGRQVLAPLVHLCEPHTAHAESDDARSPRRSPRRSAPKRELSAASSPRAHFDMAHPQFSAPVGEQKAPSVASFPGVSQPTAAAPTAASTAAAPAAIPTSLPSAVVAEAAPVAQSGATVATEPAVSAVGRSTAAGD
jgi:hypothetical protein